MSLLSIITPSKRVENGLMWSSVFTLSTLPLSLCSYKFLLPKLTINDNEKKIVNEQIIKILLTSAAFIGFLYGFNTKKRLLI